SPRRTRPARPRAPRDRRSFRALEQHQRGLFDEALEGLHEPCPDGAVDDAMVAGDRAGHHRPDRELSIDDDRALLAGPDREDAALRRVDDGGELLDPEHAEIGDRERAALVILRTELAG